MSKYQGLSSFVQFMQQASGFSERGNYIDIFQLLSLTYQQTTGIFSPNIKLFFYFFLNLIYIFPSCSDKTFSQLTLALCDKFNHLLPLIFQISCLVFALTSSKSTLSCAQSYPALWDPTDCSPCTSVHEIFQARTGVDWHALLQGIFMIKGLSPVSSTAGGLTAEPLGS